MDVKIQIRDRATYVEDKFSTEVRELLDKVEEDLTRLGQAILSIPHIQLQGDYKDLVGVITVAAQAYGFTLIFIRGDDQSVDFLVKRTVG